MRTSTWRAFEHLGWASLALGAVVVWSHTVDGVHPFLLGFFGVMIGGVIGGQALLAILALLGFFDDEP